MNEWKVGGILNIISATFMIWYGPTLAIYYYSTPQLKFGIDSIIFMTVFIVFAALPLIGGIYALRQSRWALTLSGSIVACCFITISGLPALIFTVLSRKDFSIKKRSVIIGISSIIFIPWLFLNTLFLVMMFNY
ncbi:hypothetical protein ACFLTY_02455 [Chloroflexota bacterium]